MIKILERSRDTKIRALSVKTPYSHLVDRLDRSTWDQRSLGMKVDPQGHVYVKAVNSRVAGPLIHPRTGGLPGVQIGFLSDGVPGGPLSLQGGVEGQFHIIPTLVIRTPTKLQVLTVPKFSFWSDNRPAFSPQALCYDSRQGETGESFKSLFGEMEIKECIVVECVHSVWCWVGFAIVFHHWFRWAFRRYSRDNSGIEKNECCIKIRVGRNPMQFSPSSQLQIIFYFWERMMEKMFIFGIFFSISVSALVLI